MKKNLPGNPLIPLLIAICASAATYPSTSAAATTGEELPPVLSYIRECESGNDYRAVSATGTGGAYQFSEQGWALYGDGTWQYAEQAPREAQDAAALKLYKVGGTNPWRESKRCWERKLKSREPIVDPEVQEEVKELIRRVATDLSVMLHSIFAATEKQVSVVYGGAP